MRYEVTKHIGETTHVKEYEGTPEEIAELIQRTEKQPSSPKFNVPNLNLPDIDKVAKEVSKRVGRFERAQGIKY